MLDNEMIVTIQITKGLMASFCIYLFTYMFYTFIFCFDYKNKLPNEVHLFMILMSHFYSIFNFIIYLNTNLFHLNQFKLFLSVVKLMK